MNNELEIECPICGKLIYRYGIYEDVNKPYRCTNGHKFTSVDYHKMWLEAFKREK